MLDDSITVDTFFDHIADWDVLDACLDALLIAAANSNDHLAVLPARARRIGQRGPAIVAALDHLLADEAQENRYIRGVLMTEVAPHLPLDTTTRARLAAPKR